MSFDQAECRRPPRSTPAAVPAAVATKTQVPCQTAGSEKISWPPGVGTVCSSPPVWRSRPAGGAAEQPELPVLPALHRRSRRRATPGSSSRDRGRSRSGAADRSASSAGAAATRPARARARCRPSRCCRSTALAGRDDEVAVRGIDGGAVSRPDRRVARGARARRDQPVPVRAERVPDVRDPPVRSDRMTTCPW